HRRGAGWSPRRHPRTGTSPHPCELTDGAAEAGSPRAAGRTWSPTFGGGWRFRGKGVGERGSGQLVAMERPARSVAVILGASWGPQAGRASAIWTTLIARSSNAASQ